uniref:Amidohydrolase 3 domain-containing protein n=1 Tax=Chromera velia CCMP2878 TaxID=1169474 RepID=A0A0G4ICF2_9ALVE|eukprot:Cvel_13008.t1-p1 / transcript=Cvel_13008.t1 / gene=Cvel_13008 / organism=Chromera_velia_CCMP2878 / gene_product=hypothetical protein / transcript_product=hypothetical protein / location=Cvel_scaffold873:847-4370(+) / protein_length=686 / sequence_SO=supercontig / SO=protein_coding / is_pseudo=false
MIEPHAQMDRSTSPHVIYTGTFLSCVPPSGELERLPGGLLVNMETGLIEGVGAETELKGQAPDARVERIDGDCLCVPAFHDAHVHALAVGVRREVGCSVRDCRNWDEAAGLMRGHVERGGAKSGWLVAGGWQRDWFDLTKPAEMAGRVGDSRFEEMKKKGWVRRCVLMEEAADLAKRLLPPLETGARRAALRNIQSWLLAHGIVGYQEPGVSAADVQAYLSEYRETRKGDPLPLVRLCVRLNPGRFRSELKSVFTDLAGGLPSSSSFQLSEGTKADREFDEVTPFPLLVDGVKIFLDGVIEDGTGLLLEPYNEWEGGGETGRHSECMKEGGLEDGVLTMRDEEWKGNALWSCRELKEVEGALRELPKSCDSTMKGEAGTERAVKVVHVHAIGDGAVRQAMDAFSSFSSSETPRKEETLPGGVVSSSHKTTQRGTERETKGGRTSIVLAHCQLASEKDVKRSVEVGAVPVFSPLWFDDEPQVQELLLKRLGPERFGRQYPWGSFLRHGNSGGSVHLQEGREEEERRKDPQRTQERPPPFCFGSDHPVSGLCPLAGLRTAVSVGMPGSVALCAYTYWSACVNGFGDLSGVLRVGRKADFVVLAAEGPEGHRRVFAKRDGLAEKEQKQNSEEDGKRGSFLECRYAAAGKAEARFLAAAFEQFLGNERIYVKQTFLGGKCLHNKRADSDR